MRGVVLWGALACFLVAGGAAASVDLSGLPVDTSNGAGEAERLAEMALSNSPTGGTAPARDVAPSVPAPDMVGGDYAVPAVVGAGVLGFAGLATYAAFALLGSRFSTPAEVLQNEVRERIYVYLRTRVGANLKQITDDLKLTTTNAIWHLRKLEDAGLIHSRRFNGYKVFYPAEGGVEARKLSLSLTALANENARSVFEFVVSNPGTHQREIARALDVNHGTVRWHLKKLRRAEVLAEARQGKTSVYFPTDTGVAALQNFKQQRATPAPVVLAAP